MVLSTKDIIPVDPVTGEIMWDALTEKEAENLRNRHSLAQAIRAHNRAYRWKLFAVLSSIAIVGVILATCGALPADAHDLAAWSDPARDQWFRNLQVPGQNMSCCNFTDAAAMDPDKVKQDSNGTWWVDLGAGYVPVPPNRVVKNPVSIDGLPYIFMMASPTEDSPNKIRCFVPMLPTY